MRIILTIIGLLFCFNAAAQNFSCPIGKRGACLDYNDNVCDGWNAKCVKKDAQCFDSYTCGYGGFVCKSDMDNLGTKAKKMASNYDDFRSCISRSNDMDDISACISMDNIRN